MKQFLFYLSVLFGLSIGGVRVQAQAALAPAEIPGEVVYIPFSTSITVDGKLEDWVNVPHETVDRGTITSTLAGENTSFSFALAADIHNLYLTMSSVEQNIITGQHDANFWNEDSLEFYFDFGWERSQNAYDDKVFQININPGDMGNTDPEALHITGTNSTNTPVMGFVFKTEDGWGFEVAVPFPDGYMPEHGKAIGFQAQMNGATTKDRDVKLIWSLADTADISWNDPSVFGFGVFYAIGQTDMPETPIRPEPRVPEIVPAGPVVSTNQVGYFIDAPKFGVLAGTEESVPWKLLEWQTDIVIAQGMTPPGHFDSASGNTVQIADFSAVTIKGTYFLDINGTRSYAFHIGDDIYSSLKIDALRYFYLNRSGIELTPEFAGAWARPAGHLSDSAITCYKGSDPDGNNWTGCDYTLDVHKGWYDAGDYGKYVVNAGIATW
ncbi:MAG TPA: glycoside hydrolase family 9 protein, partial [Phototrophicaceae bacterium]|nr:glycoside hydrolase family 9 protein [Phototrophicaceae bacterium]